MNFNQKLDLLISLGKETKTLKVEDVTRYFEKDSEEYRTVILELEHKGIEVLTPMDLEVDFPEDEENIDITLFYANEFISNIQILNDNVINAFDNATLKSYRNKNNIFDNEGTPKGVPFNLYF